jgi:hypothetical protein
METKVSLHIDDHIFCYRTVKIALIVFFVSDGLNKLLYLITENDTPFFSPSLFSRMIFEAIAVIFILVRLDKKRFIFVELVFFLFAMYAIGMFIYLINYQFDFRYFYHLSLFNKYMFAFIVYFFIYKLREDQLIEGLMSICETIFRVNSIFAIIGAVFKIQLFKSYVFFDYRFGYNGIIPAVNESSLFYFIALSYLYYKKFILKRKLGFSYAIILAAFLVGTKAVYLFIVVLIIFHLIRVSTLKARIMAICGIAVITTGFIWWYFSSNSQVITYFKYLINTRGLFSGLVSGRDEYLRTKFFDNIQLWNPVNYLFGGQDQLHFLIEMDLFDLFLYFGVVGSFLYLLLFFKSIFSIDLKKKFNLFFVVTYFALAALGGHFFVSALNSLYLVIFCLFIYHCDFKKKYQIENISS